jgi:hypothetical protein
VYPGAFEYFVSTGQDGLSGPQHVPVNTNASDIWVQTRGTPYRHICRPVRGLPEACALTLCEGPLWPHS